MTTKAIGNYFAAADWSFVGLKKLIKTNYAKFPLPKMNEFIGKLVTYKNLFNQIKPALLSRNGFSETIINAYRPTLEKVLFQAMILKSELLEREQLPGQVSLFGLGRPFDEARKLNSYDKDGTRYFRQREILASSMAIGKNCSISFALNKVVDGYYTVIPVAMLQPSHIGSSQNPLHFIPEAQPRNRATSESGHNTPKLIAEHLRPAEIIEGATAFTGAPIVNRRGEVIQGNGRAYTLKFYYANFSNDPAGYVKFLRDNAPCYDYLISDLNAIENPVLVRMVKVSDEQAIEFGQFTQKDLEAVANETTQIKSKVGLVSEEALDSIINELLAKDTGESTLSELVRESTVLKIMIKEKILRGDDMEVYTRNGIINETGVNFVSKFLLNLIFKEGDVNTSDVFIQLPIPLQKAIEKSALYILKCRGDRSINLEVSKAVLGLRDYLIFKVNGSLAQWKKQIDIFENSISEKFSELEFKLIEIFSESKNQKTIIDYFKTYASLATAKAGDMFENERPPLSKSDAVRSAFSVELEVKPTKTATTNKTFALAKAKAIALILLQEQNLN